SELALAAAAYILSSTRFSKAPSFWPWHEQEFKPEGHEHNLQRAGVLILAAMFRSPKGLLMQRLCGENPLALLLHYFFRRLCLPKSRADSLSCSRACWP